MEELAIKEWNKEYDCGFITIPDTLNKKRALAIELKINYGISKIDNFYFVVDIMNKKRLKEDLYELSKKYNQEISFFPKDFFNILNFNEKIKLSHGFINSNQAMLAGKILKEYKN